MWAQLYASTTGVVLDYNSLLKDVRLRLVRRLQRLDRARPSRRGGLKRMEAL